MASHLMENALSERSESKGTILPSKAVRSLMAGHPVENLLSDPT